MGKKESFKQYLFFLKIEEIALGGKKFKVTFAGKKIYTWSLGHHTIHARTRVHARNAHQSVVPPISCWIVNGKENYKKKIWLAFWSNELPNFEGFFSCHSPSSAISERILAKKKMYGTHRGISFQSPFIVRMPVCMCRCHSYGTCAGCAGVCHMPSSIKSCVRIEQTPNNTPKMEELEIHI